MHIILPFIYRFLLFPSCDRTFSSQILLCLGTVLPDSTNLSAGVLVRAIGTGFIALGGYTLMHLTQMTAEVELGSFCSATCTIDTLWCNLIGVIHLALIS